MLLPGLRREDSSLRLVPMTSAGHAFAQLTDAILARYFAQNSLPPPLAADRADFATQLWALIAERGLPRPLGPAERGEPGEMSDEEVNPLLERVLAGVSPTGRVALAGPAKQLVKACFYPEFKTCRDSFREISPDGSCRRQELARVRGRVSGTHCVDCPHWVALTPEQHIRFLFRNWRAEGREELEAHRGVFLPEDFRALRRFLHGWARAGI
jgi:hypothetical protein